MAQFSVPASPQLHKQKLDNFKGVDFANNAVQVAMNRSPNAENIISDLAGKPVKRTGYVTEATFSGEINGIYRLKTEDVEKVLVHSGTKLYEWKMDGSVPVLLNSDMNDDISTAFQNDKKLYILDGKTYLCYGEHEEGTFSVKPVVEIATVPLCMATMKPDGTGGGTVNDVNILTKKRTYSYYGTETDKVYKLSVDDFAIDSGDVTAEILQNDGSWTKITEGNGITVDRTKGTITFDTAPGKSPETGADNVKITFSADSEYATSLINKCTIAIQYGMNGSTDRVFVSGNPEAINFHYWSAVNDPCYFPGLNYAYLGQDSSAIIGYSTINDTLVVHKEDNEQDQTIFLVTGKTNEKTGKTEFAISGSVAGVGAVSKRCFQRLDTEPLFLSKQGVYAVTTQMFTAERYAQVRSWYVNPRLIQEPNLENAVAKEFNNYYYLAVNGNVYVADGRQKSYEHNAPQSTFQYEWYYLTGIHARVFWEYDGCLYYGDAAGNIRRFKRPGELHAYTDDGEPIHALWDTPYLTMGTITNTKTLKGFWVMLSPYSRSSVDIFYRFKGNLKLVKHSTMDIFDFGDIDFSRFSFNTDDSPMVVAANSKAKKFMLIQFRLENNVADEGFGFFAMEAAYNITGKYKG